MKKDQLNRGYTQGRGYSDLSRNCKNGKPCGAACISSRKICKIELPPSFSKSLSKQRDLVEKIQGKLEAAIAIDKPLKTEAEVVQYVKDNYKEWLTGGMEERFYGGPGQRGVLDSKIWFLGQEGFAGEGRFGVSPENTNPIDVVNSIRLHNNLYNIARQEVKGQTHVTTGVENFLRKKPFVLENETTVEEWLKTQDKEYYGRLGRMVRDLGYSGDLLAANASSFLMPTKQKALGDLIDVMKRNGVDVKTFANGAFKDSDAWYKASVEARLPLMMKAVKRYKPEIVYIGQQAPPEKKVFSNTMLYAISKKFDIPVYHVKFGVVDYKYVIISLPGGKKTVVLNGGHPTHLASNSVKQKEFRKELLSSLRSTGKPPKNVEAKEVSKEAMDKVLG
jgi:hypothetical protein